MESCEHKSLIGDTVYNCVNSLLLISTCYSTNWLAVSKHFSSQDLTFLQC